MNETRNLRIIIDRELLELARIRYRDARELIAARTETDREYRRLVETRYSLYRDSYRPTYESKHS